MHILAFNSSPRDNQTSLTELLLQKFLDGAREAGATTETLYLKNYQINHCLGCLSCWVKTNSRCVQQDDMTEELFERYHEADLAVLATPLYHFNVNARMKIFIERTLPILHPLFVDLGEHTGQPSRSEKMPKVVVLSVCGSLEPKNFQALSLNMQMIFGSQLVAEIYRHSSWALNLPSLALQTEQVLVAVAKAGEEIVRAGKVSQATLKAVSQDLAPRELLISLTNEWR